MVVVIYFIFFKKMFGKKKVFHFFTCQYQQSRNPHFRPHKSLVQGQDSDFSGEIVVPSISPAPKDPNLSVFRLPTAGVFQ